VQIWRIAFFGRLERKGIKLFVEAVDRLQEEYDIAKLTEFEVYIVGPDATIDMVPPSLPLDAFVSCSSHSQLCGQFSDDKSGGIAAAQDFLNPKLLAKPLQVTVGVQICCHVWAILAGGNPHQYSPST